MPFTTIEATAKQNSLTSKNSNCGSTEAELQQFLQVYQFTSNKNAPLTMSLAEIMFAQ